MILSETRLEIHSVFTSGFIHTWIAPGIPSGISDGSRTGFFHGFIQNFLPEIVLSGSQNPSPRQSGMKEGTTVPSSIILFLVFVWESEQENEKNLASQVT